MPRGRRRNGESLADTVRREVLEETCWSVGDLSVLAVGHFHITSAVPEGYAYPNPDFLQLVYLAEAVRFHDERTIEDDWVEGCELLAVDSLQEHRISNPQRILLAHAVGGARARHGKSPGPPSP